MTKDAVTKLVNRIMKEHKFKFNKKDKQNLEAYAYKVMNNPNTYADVKDKDGRKKHAVYTMMEIVSTRNKK